MKRKKKEATVRRRFDKTSSGDETDARPGETAARIESRLSDDLRSILASVRGKSVAIASGKGGVGKTITAANLSIFYARAGYRVGLIDLDPLSDVCTVLGLAEPELTALQQGAVPGKGAFDEVRIRAFRNLDLIFPAAKLRSEEREQLADKIYLQHLRELDAGYDLLVFDMPAGSGLEDNLAYLPFMGLLVLVTNPEPTAHVSAGAYLRKVLSAFPDMDIHIWHNRFRQFRQSGFDPLDLVGNYNRNVAEEDRLPETQVSRLHEVAFVPEDPSLNLLHGEPAILLNIQRQMLDILRCMQDSRLPSFSTGLGIPERAFELVQYHISRFPPGDDLESYLNQLGDYLSRLLEDRLATRPSGADPFTSRERAALLSYLRRVREDSLRARMLSVSALLENKVTRVERSGRGPAGEADGAGDKTLERELSGLLMELGRLPAEETTLRNYSGLLMFYFSLYKLFQSRTIIGVLGDLIPRKKNSRGAAVRDRHRQISYLVEGNRDYQKKYFSRIRSLYPIINRQISAVVRTFELSGLLFRNANGELLRQAYLKLFINFVHDTIYSGLSVVVGFKYRSAAQAFRRGAETILELLSVEPPQP